MLHIRKGVLQNPSIQSGCAHTWRITRLCNGGHCIETALSNVTETEIRIEETQCISIAARGVSAVAKDTVIGSRDGTPLNTFCQRTSLWCTMRSCSSEMKRRSYRRMRFLGRARQIRGAPFQNIVPVKIRIARVECGLKCRDPVRRKSENHLEQKSFHYVRTTPRPSHRHTPAV